MNTEKLYSTNPYNDKHIELFKEFESNNNIENKVSSYLTYIKDNYDELMYNKVKENDNEINETVFILENNKIKDSCNIKGERDRKISKLEFTNLKDKNFISQVSDYVFNTLGMVQIYLSLDNDDKQLKNILESKGFENIGEVNGKITYIKEQVFEEEISKAI